MSAAAAAAAVSSLLHIQTSVGRLLSDHNVDWPRCLLCRTVSAVNPIVMMLSDSYVGYRYAALEQPPGPHGCFWAHSGSTQHTACRAGVSTGQVISTCMVVPTEGRYDKSDLDTWITYCELGKPHSKPAPAGMGVYCAPASAVHTCTC